MNNDEMLIVIKDLFENMEKRFEKKVEEVKNHSGVLIENLENDIKAVAEGQETLNRKIDDTKDEINSKMNVLDTNMNIIKNYIIGVDDKLNEHEMFLKRVK